jgi:guanylate cyclase
MVLLDRVERRLALPGDDETLRKRKVAAFFAGLSGVTTALLFSVLYTIGDAPALAWLFALTVVWTGITMIILWARPHTYYYAVLFTAIYVTIHPWVVVIASGGYQSGMLLMMWALIGPASSVVLIGIRPALFIAALYMVMACVAALLDPWAVANAPVVPDWIRLLIGLLSAVVPAMMVVFITLFLFRQVERARQQADSLLLNILPTPVAERLKANPELIAQDYDEVTVLFADIVGFTSMSAAADAGDVVELLNAIFSDFDHLADKYKLEKIKTVGDAYMVVGGLPEPCSDHVESVAAFAVEALEVVKRYRAWNGDPIRLRIGIHTGPIVAGVIGRRKFIYDLWGDTVNTASRMESYGLADVIQVTPEVRAKLEGKYAFEMRPAIDVKGKGMMVTYLLKPAETQLSTL